MNPLRALFLSLAKMPPTLMLLIIIGLAVIITMSVTNTIGNEESTRREITPGSVDPSQKQKNVVYTLTYIPAGAKIEQKQVAMRSMNELDAYDDAEVSLASVLGATPSKPIPAHVQLRKSDFAP
ncbi:MAG: SAF domain-containing protein [Candidatus Obscuribacterales bacterium]|nr:hypothetical protein [Cyanobacteria bacterium SZAS LIN-5]RTL35703.1 MAG: hypothetical protein EKK48_28915 [Candidatus Melainabacteria bacterium]